MKSLTRVGLPILLVAGVVFGITFIQMYSPPEEEKTTTDDRGKKENADRQVLKFFTTKAVANTAGNTAKHLWYWDSTIEVGAPGHFEFWCQNRHDQPVTIWVPATNCQCAGAESAVVPPDAYREYAVLSALCGSPLCPAPGPLAAFAHLDFSKKLNWLPLFKGEERPSQTIPAVTSPGSPQFALIRLGWTGKGEPGPKGISAELYAQKANEQIPARDVLGAEVNVVASFEPVRRDGSQWTSIRETSIGELRENGEVKQTIYLASFTRRYFLYTIDSERQTPCIAWTEPVPATDEEIASLNAHNRGTDDKLRRIQSLYKFEITVRERTEVASGQKKKLEQLDLGPIDRKLTIAGVDAGNWALMLRGHVLGDFTIRHAEGGRIDLATFAADQGNSKEVTLMADRPGLDLALVESEITPNYLQVKLEPQKDLPDGRKQWKLRVTVPKDMLHGSLPESSGVVLKTSGSSSRRMRLPVRGSTYDSGGPRL